ncbi:acyl-CoA thioesterase [Kribbella lupini]|uniref:Thioesterase family protein n=1 Tax=Kribbella lupini TaxID=291602 RepID=A0ABN2A096_9ACTN
MTFSHPVLVRWSDIDSYDHVNNVRYFDYLQEARIAFLANVFGVGADEFFGRSPVVLVSQTVDYLRPILLRHPPYAVDVWVSAVGTSSYTLQSRIVDHAEGLVYCKATSVLVTVTADTHAKRPLDEAERAALGKHVSVA